MSKWINHILEESTELWTRMLVMDDPWCGRVHGQMEFHLAQAITGHRWFGKYLMRIGKEKSKAYHHCEAITDKAYHTLFECRVWEGER